MDLRSIATTQNIVSLVFGWQGTGATTCPLCRKGAPQRDNQRPACARCHVNLSGSWRYPPYMCGHDQFCETCLQETCPECGAEANYGDDTDLEPELEGEPMEEVVSTPTPHVVVSSPGGSVQRMGQMLTVPNDNGEREQTGLHPQAVSSRGGRPEDSEIRTESEHFEEVDMGRGQGRSSGPAASRAGLGASGGASATRSQGAEPVYWTQQEVTQPMRFHGDDFRPEQNRAVERGTSHTGRATSPFISTTSSPELSHPMPHRPPELRPQQTTSFGTDQGRPAEPEISRLGRETSQVPSLRADPPVAATSAGRHAGSSTAHEKRKAEVHEEGLATKRQILHNPRTGSLTPPPTLGSRVQDRLASPSIMTQPNPPTRHNAANSSLNVNNAQDEHLPVYPSRHLANQQNTHTQRPPIITVSEDGETGAPIGGKKRKTGLPEGVSSEPIDVAPARSTRSRSRANSMTPDPPNSSLKPGTLDPSNVYGVRMTRARSRANSVTPEPESSNASIGRSKRSRARSRSPPQTLDPGMLAPNAPSGSRRSPRLEAKRRGNEATELEL